VIVTSVRKNYFKGVVKQYIKSNNLFLCADTSFKKCPDNYVGTISKSEENLFIKCELRFENRHRTRPIAHENPNRIVIVLESPHINEFRSSLIAPALGKTGNNLSSELHRKLYCIISNDEQFYDVYICNPIQYQCSLGLKCSNNKDIIFKKMWESKQVKHDFLSRIEKIKPTIIINCCTGGKEPNGLRTMVQEQINSAFPKIARYVGHHPSSPKFMNQSDPFEKI